MEENRPDWDQYIFSIAKACAERSSCPSRKVGAVIYDPDTHFILTTAYNGAPRGLPHCGEACSNRVSGKSWEKCNAVHAELNAIIAAAKAGVSIDGAHMGLTVAPCVFCSRAIIQAGIKHVVAMGYYSHPEAEKLLVDGGVSLKIYSGVPDLLKG